MFEYLINPPKVEMPRMVKASPILFHFKFHSISRNYPKDLVSTYLEYISFLDGKIFQVSFIVKSVKN